MFESRYNSLVGLDIGSTSVKVVQLSGVGKTPQLERVAVVSIDPNADPGTATITAIKEAVREAKLTTDKVATSVAGPLVAVRHLQFPKLSPDELKGAIYWEGSQVIPFDIEDVYTDFQILPSGEDTTEENIEVLFVTVSRKLVDDRFKFIRRSRLEPRVIDLDVLAMLNCFQNGKDRQSGQLRMNRRATALLNVGARFTNLVITSDKAMPFPRDIMIAGSNFTAAIQKATGVSFEEADALKKLPNSISVDENVTIMESIFTKLVNEIRLSFDYFLLKEGGSQVDQILLGGGASRTVGLKGFISDTLAIPVDEWNPLENIEINPKKFDSQKPTELTSLLTVATGLALRKDPQ